MARDLLHRFFMSIHKDATWVVALYVLVITTMLVTCVMAGVILLMN